MSNELDKQLSDRLRGYESPVDAEALWQAVRPPRKRRRLLWLWLLLGVSLLTGAGWWWQSLPNTADAVLPQQTLPEQALPSTNPQAKTETLIPPTTALLTTATQERLATKAPKGRPSETEELVPQISSTTLPEGGLRSAIAEVSTGRHRITERLAPSQEHKLTEELAPVTSTLREELVSRVEHTRTDGLVSTIPTLYLLGELASTSEPIDEPTLPNCSTQMPDVLRSSRWFAQLQGGYYVPKRELTRVDSFDNRLAHNRRNSEEVLEALSAELTVGYHLSSRWQVRSGLGYTQLNLRYSEDDYRSRIDTIEGLQTVTYQPDNTIDSIYGAVPALLEERFRKRTYNSFRQWELPLLVGYRFGRRKLQFQAEAGVRLLLQRSWEGEVLNNGSTQAWEEQDWYRKSFGLSLEAGLGVRYRVGARTSLVASVNARYSPKSFSRASLPFRENYQLLGASIGVRRSF